MRVFTTHWRWLLVVAVIAAGSAADAVAQRTVTLTLNAATIPDTINVDSFMEVRGAVNGTSPVTLYDGNIIDWNDSSTLEPENIGGDYWRIQFQIADTTNLTFKFYSQQSQDSGLDGWEADPNPNIPPGSNDTTLVVHYFESQALYRGASGDRGDYDWRPYEVKEDSVAVWFRVAMYGTEADFDEYDPASEEVIGVRGGAPGGDWSSAITTLMRESTNDNAPGYSIYSGVAYYHESTVGETQEYKFTIERGENTAYEEGDLTGNRSFTIPAEDTTLHWVYYGNTPPSATEPVQSAVIFSVDLRPLEAIGVFDRARGDTLEVRGDFNGWDCPADATDDCLLPAVPGENIYEQQIAITAIPGSERSYKFFLNFNDTAFQDEFGVDIVPDGWEEPISTTGANRTFVYEGNAGGFQDLGVQFFNDILEGNIVEDGVSTDLTFTVDMEPATDPDLPQPFDPAADSVIIQVADPIWAFTQGIPLPDGGGWPYWREFELTDSDGDMIYEGTITVEGPTYAGIQYKYAYGVDGSYQVEAGGTTADLGRKRTRYIAANEDGSWPAEWAFPEETYTPNGNLPYELNPAATGVERTDGELPDRIMLSGNYPNPFNPSTTFEYAITETQHVRVRVYDVMGRLVTTLVDGVQPAATYRVRFDAGDLASGVYFYQLETPSRVLTQKMTLLR